MGKKTLYILGIALSMLVMAGISSAIFVNFNLGNYYIPVAALSLIILFMPIMIFLTAKAGKTMLERLLVTFIAAEIWAVLLFIIIYNTEEEKPKIGILLLATHLMLTAPALISCGIVEFVKWRKIKKNKTNDTVIDDAINTK